MHSNPTHVCIHAYMYMYEGVCTCNHVCLMCSVLQGARMLYERESQIAINYSRLEKKLKEVRK